MKFQVRSGLEDLPERIDISLITEVATGTCAPPPNVLREHLDVPPPSSASNLQPSPLSFSLISADGSLADQIAPDQSRWADWTDGLNMVRHNGGHVATQENTCCGWREHDKPPDGIVPLGEPSITKCLFRARNSRRRCIIEPERTSTEAPPFLGEWRNRCDNSSTERWLSTQDMASLILGVSLPRRRRG